TRVADRRFADGDGGFRRSFVAGEACALHLAGNEDRLATVFGVGLAAGVGDDLAQQRVTLVPIFVLLARLSVRTSFEERRQDRGQISPGAFVILAGNARGVLQQ